MTVLREVAAECDGDPLAYLLAVMRDQAQPQALRILAAKAALPYTAPRLAAVRVAEGGDRLDHEDWLRLLQDEGEPSGQ